MKIINRMLEREESLFESCKKIVVKIGNINNVKAILIENIDGKGRSGKSYIRLLTKNISKHVPIRQERKTVTTNAKLSLFFSEKEVFISKDCKFNFFKCLAVVFSNLSIYIFLLID